MAHILTCISSLIISLTCLRYVSALQNVTNSVRNVWNASDTKTVIFTAADHGQIPPGGHGGPEKGIFELLATFKLVVVREIWCAIFQKGSNLSSLPSYSGPKYSSRKGSVKDIVSTMSLLLGIPPPAHNEGLSQ